MIIIRLWLRELEGRKERWNQREDRGGKLCLCFRPCNFRISETESMVFLTKTRLGCLSFGLALVLLYRLRFALLTFVYFLLLLLLLSCFLFCFVFILVLSAIHQFSPCVNVSVNWTLYILWLKSNESISNM